MKKLAMLGVVTFAASACSDPVTPRTATPELSRADAVLPAAAAGRGRPIPDEYIVVLRQDVQDVPGLARRLAAQHGSAARLTYETALKGFAVKLPAQAAAALARDPNVAYVEQDQEVALDATQTMDAAGDPWGLDRINQRDLPLDRAYTYTSTGTGVRAYIIDTGIQTNHPDFGSRASAVYDAIGDGRNGQDCNGHGTHVAGTTGGATYGVAKNVYLRAVRVLNCSGSGTSSQVLAGIDWVTKNHISPAVANMSLGGGFSQAENDAVNALANSGVFIAVAAGNSNADACGSSPASAANATTIGATTKTDARATYSNYGGCVDLYAPGSAIKSDWLSGGTNIISGTSMATPHVTGVAALYKATYGDASYSTIRSWLVNNATTNRVTGNPTGTPNRLLYKSTL